MPRLWKYWQLSNCHRDALRKWLPALKRANLASLLSELMVYNSLP
jgi:hypothetical protein